VDEVYNTNAVKNYQLLQDEIQKNPDYPTFRLIRLSVLENLRYIKTITVCEIRLFTESVLC
jgi:hypothetical protein